MGSSRSLPFKSGDSAYVGIADYPGRRFLVLVRDIQPEHIVTNIPSEEESGDSIKVVPGQRWTFTTYHPQLGISRFTTRVIKVVRAAGSEVLLEWPTGLHRIQRRKMVRMPVSVSVELVDVKDPDVVLQAETKDLSGGGMAIITERRVSPGSLWNISLSLPDDVVVEAQARCVKSSRLGQDDENRWLCGFEFIKLKQADEDALVRLVFDTERERIRKNRID